MNDETISPLPSDETPYEFGRPAQCFVSPLQEARLAILRAKLAAAAGTREQAGLVIEYGNVNVHTPWLVNPA